MDRHLRDSELYEERYGYKESRSSVRFYVAILLIFLCLLGFRAFWIQNFGGVQVDGSSMKQTLLNKEMLLMKYVKDSDDLKHGDVIVVHVEHYPEYILQNTGKTPENQTRYLIKRLIAIEGDKVRCTDGQVEICYAGTTAWVELDEPYAYYTDKEGYDFGEYTVGDGEVFFLGDNRNNSKDSRYKEGGSTLQKLYLQSDITGVVPQWAIDKKEFLAKVLFRQF